MLSRIARRLVRAIKPTRPPAKEEQKPNVRSSRAGKRVAVIGFGAQGQKLCRFIHGLGYDVVAVCDLDHKRRAAAAEMLPGVLTSDDLGQMASREPEIVVIATLAESHAALIERLSQMEYQRVLCEKPVANTISDSERIRVIANRTSMRVGVNHTRLFSPDYWRIKDAINQRTTEAPIAISVSCKPGGFGNMGSHFLAQILHWADKRIARVETATFEKDRTEFRRGTYTDPDGEAAFLLEGGASLRLTSLAKDYPGRASIRLEYTDWVVEIDENRATTFRSKRTSQSERLDFARPHSSLENRYYCTDNAIGELFKPEPIKSLSLACDAVEGIVAAQICFERGSAVDLPLQANQETPYPFS